MGNSGSQTGIRYANRGAGYTYEAEAFMDLICNGARDSGVMPLRGSLEILATMDRIRERWGVCYPGE